MLFVHLGFNEQTNQIKMKKLHQQFFKAIPFAVVAIIAFFMIACTSNQPKPNPEDKTSLTEPVQAARQLEISGKINLENGIAGNSSIIVYEIPDELKIYELKESAKFLINLDLNKNYRIDFSQADCATKKIAVDTNIPDGLSGEFPPFQIQVSLFKKDATSEKIGPDLAGKIFYDPEINNFTSMVFTKKETAKR
jgi:hypothetical protein